MSAKWWRENAGILFAFAIPLWVIALTMAFMAVESWVNQGERVAISATSADPPAPTDCWVKR